MTIHVVSKAELDRPRITVWKLRGSRLWAFDCNWCGWADPATYRSKRLAQRAADKHRDEGPHLLAPPAPDPTQAQRLLFRFDMRHDLYGVDALPWPGDGAR